MNPTPFSHSSLKQYETCPRQFQEIRVLKKHPRQETEQTIYGKELHKAAEEFIRDGTPLPGQFAFVQPVLNALNAKPGRKFCEIELAMTADQQGCGFKDPKAWARGIADLLILDDDSLTAHVFDYKTGKDRYPDLDQLRLLALLVFANYPHIRIVKGGLLFVVKGSAFRCKVGVEDIEPIMWDYRERIGRLVQAHETDVWNPKPSGLCNGWCPCTDCVHNSKH
jgi:hypothetical protein